MAKQIMGDFILARIKNVNVSKLVRYRYQDKGNLPRIEGIYLVGHSPEEIVYVGQTRNFRDRHRSHHRDQAFKEIEKTDGPLFIWCWPLPSDLKKTRIEGDTNLTHAENAFRILLDPEINDTPIAGSKPKIVSPEQKCKYNYNGSVYVSLNFLPEYSVDLLNGLVPAFHTTVKKLHHVQHAVRQKSPCFLISSLPIDFLQEPGMETYKKLLSPDPYWRRETTLYFLEYMFRSQGYTKTPEREDFDICIYGDLERSVVRRIYLNDLDDFKNFRQSYLTIGMTNCSDHIAIRNDS
ncbi:GIY-YIG nuclease family protein [Nodosilinea nodulosa]|uniref:GIY-YIG nuclease family protein n=1 Tax=Nodosilinea nodulosa TaxID=416001 RepID=UPI0012D7C9F0|nr:GIY-YIG nuclease family protein [Nodosilinea nodulosa]